MYNPQEFFSWEMDSGNTQENPEYLKLHTETAKKILIDLHPISLLDIGCGTGAMIEYLLNNGVDAYGLSNNHHEFDFFIRRNPAHVDNYFILDAKDLSLVTDKKEFDMISAIEIFEHLDDETLKKATKAIAGKCKWFLFSSIPYKQPWLDDKIGHINVKSKDGWVRYFKSFGIRYKEDWTLPTEWTMLFTAS
jgi:cyclopropane fatty-acyl-phospholipid synthase-like methyltransferase